MFRIGTKVAKSALDNIPHQQCVRAPKHAILALTGYVQALGRIVAGVRCRRWGFLLLIEMENYSIPKPCGFQSEISPLKSLKMVTENLILHVISALRPI
jgi:hypothetical protein